MDVSSRYAVTLPGVPGRHGPPEVAVVHATGEVTAAGPVYADAAGTFRVEIIGDVARPLAEPDGSTQHTCLHAVPLPRAGPDRSTSDPNPVMFDFSGSANTAGTFDHRH